MKTGTKSKYRLPTNKKAKSKFRWKLKTVINEFYNKTKTVGHK